VPDCYTEPSVANITTALLLISGICVSYVPQYYAIVKARSSDGLNFTMLAVALLSSYLTMINSGILNWQSVVCCLNLSSIQCLKNNLATEQIFGGLICYTALYVLFLVYFNTQPTETETREMRVRSKRIALATFIGVLGSSVIVGIITGVLYYDVRLHGSTLETVAQVFGYTSGALMIVQWAPQIYTTWKRKSPGSLSILMLILQMPGSLLVMFFQAVLNRSHVSIWVPYFFQFVEQLILVVLCAYFILQARKKKSGDETALLIGDNDTSMTETPTNKRFLC